MTNPALGTNAATSVLPAPASPRNTPLDDQLPAPRSSFDAVPSPRQAPPDAASTVLLVDPDPNVHQTICHQLASSGAHRITACPSTAEAVTWLETATPGELALVSLRLGAKVHEVIAALRSAGWRRILALASARDARAAADAMRAGATGIVATTQIHPSGSNIPSSIDELTDREIDVIRMVADGRSNKWIGERLDLSALTIKSHLARIGRKLGTGERAHIVFLAFQARVLR